MAAAHGTTGRPAGPDVERVLYQPWSGSRNRHRRRTVAILLAGVVAIAVAGYGSVLWLQGSVSSLPILEECPTQVGDVISDLDPEQAGNAATIAAVAVRRGLPARAASIAIATAMQESKLRNLEYGDRDSLGLFQQRPSQGWGTAAQVRDPVHATNAFYDALVKIKGWTAMPITQVAQKVQHSAYPQAYAQHEPEARALASALTGYSPGALTCTLRPSTAATQTAGTDGLTARARAVATAATRELGRTGTSVPGEPTAVRFTFTGTDASHLAWAAAEWAVARGRSLDVDSVTVDGRVWRRSAGQRWTSASAGSSTGTSSTAGLGTGSVVVVRVTKGVSASS